MKLAVVSIVKSIARLIYGALSLFIPSEKLRHDAAVMLTAVFLYLSGVALLELVFFALEMLISVPSAFGQWVDPTTNKLYYQTVMSDTNGLVVYTNHDFKVGIYRNPTNYGAYLADYDTNNYALFSRHLYAIDKALGNIVPPPDPEVETEEFPGGITWVNDTGGNIELLAVRIGLDSPEDGPELEIAYRLSSTNILHVIYPAPGFPPGTNQVRGASWSAGGRGLILPADAHLRCTNTGSEVGDIQWTYNDL